MYKSGKQYHRPSFVIFYIKSEDRFFGFISSKKVGNAVKRNRSRRVLRSLVDQYCRNIKSGLYVIVAKEPIHTVSHQQLLSDFERALKYLNAYK